MDTRRLSFLAFVFGLLLAPWASADLLDELARAEVAAPADRFSLSPRERAGLRTLDVGQRLVLGSATRSLGAGRGQGLVLERIDLHAPGAVAREVANGAQAPVARPVGRRFFLGSDGARTLGFALDQAGRIEGLFASRGETWQVRGEIEGELRLAPVGEPDERFEASCELDQLPREQRLRSAPEFPSLRAGALRGSAVNAAVIAIDTDNEFMADKFGNNVSQAQTWVENLFLNMNIFYERDIGLRLLIGDEFYRTTPDPYGSGSIGGVYLSEFSEHWRTTPSLVNVERVFVSLLSGKVGSNSFSGIAWVSNNASAYCNTGFNFGGGTFGGFNLNGIGTNLNEVFSAEFVGHEIGHNLGSVHTHCYSPEIDQCFNREDDCYDGPESCPSGGPGGSSGTIMSYCHLSTQGCGNNEDLFHPTVITEFGDEIASDLANNGGTCIMPLNVNSPPVAVGEAYFMDENTTLYEAAPGVLANDTDGDLDALDAVLDSGPGGLSLNADGSFSYAPPNNFDGQVQFTYQASDGVDSSSPATVTITVRNVPGDVLFRDQYENDSSF